MSHENKTFVLIAVTVILIAAGFFFLLSALWSTSAIIVSTDKQEYGKQDVLKIAVKNDSGESVCFSSCYPYLFEKKNGEWSLYDYSECQKSDVNVFCLPGHQSKFFEIDLPAIASGIHRLGLPVCLNCKSQDNFREDEMLHSNEFSIK
jgi:hypothetical protein